MNKISKSLQNSIVALLKQNIDDKLTRKQISHQLNITKENYHIFEASLHNLYKDKIINKDKNHTYFYQKISRLSGELRTTRTGFGFVDIQDQDFEVYVSRSNLNTAFDRDIVEVQLYAETRGKRQEGFVTQIVKRFRESIVGTFHKADYYLYVTPDSPKIYRDIVIQEDTSHKAKDGQKVLVHFDGWENDQHNPHGHITEVLGDPDEPGVDIASVAYSYNLPIHFKKEIEDEARKASTDFKNISLKDRLDLRDLECFTIDPIDAKDFDDAISLEKLLNSNLKLGVHIADVSHYVQQGTPLDIEALSRGTSVYLVDRVIPMLPEYLSNDLCSLKPNVDRLAFSCFMEIDNELNVVDYQITPSIINSKKRYNYEEFQEIYDTESDSKRLPIIKMMYSLSQRLTKQRFEEGSIDFESPEVRFVMDEKGRPVEIIPKKRMGSNRLVEEFMLMANKTVAKHIFHISPNKNSLLPFIYRIHEKPDPDKMNKFFNFLKALEIPFKPVKTVSSKYFQSILDTIKGTPEETIIEQVALRSMMKAIYSDKNIGHFGLSFKDYTHFTSPIRRYPDLLVHRLLKAYTKNEIKDQKAVRKEIAEIAHQSTRMEKLAVEAERESIKLKQCEYIQKHIGDTFHGIISGVTAYGIYVEIQENYIDGFVQMTNMSDDYYVFDETTYSMTGKHTNRRVRLGDKVEIIVLGVNIEKREIDFKLLEDPEFEPFVLNVRETSQIKRKRKKRKRNSGL